MHNASSQPRVGDVVTYDGVEMVTVWDQASYRRGEVPGLSAYDCRAALPQPCGPRRGRSASAGRNVTSASLCH